MHDLVGHSEELFGFLGTSLNHEIHRLMPEIFSYFKVLAGMQPRGLLFALGHAGSPFRVVAIEQQRKGLLIIILSTAFDVKPIVNWGQDFEHIS